MKKINSNVMGLQYYLTQTTGTYDGDATRLPNSGGKTLTITSVIERPSLQQFSNEANQFCFKSEKTTAEKASIEPPAGTLREPEIGER